MFAKTLASALLLTSLAAAQDRSKPGRIDVDHYVIDAEVNPRTQTLTAIAKVRFTALDNDISSLAFELNNAFNVSSVADDSGSQIPSSRSQQDFSVRVTLPSPLVKGKPTTLTFKYDGRLTGQED